MYYSCCYIKWSDAERWWASYEGQRVYERTILSSVPPGKMEPSTEDAPTTAKERPH